MTYLPKLGDIVVVYANNKINIIKVVCIYPYDSHINYVKILPENKHKYNISIKSINYYYVKHFTNKDIDYVKKVCPEYFI